MAYQEDSEHKIMRPDFLFFTLQNDGKVATDIVDPHGFHLADALPKLQGLANYAAKHAPVYRGIESVAKVGGKLRALDMTREEVRSAIVAAKTAQSAFLSHLANDYA